MTFVLSIICSSSLLLSVPPEGSAFHGYLYFLFLFLLIQCSVEREARFEHKSR